MTFITASKSLQNFIASSSFSINSITDRSIIFYKSFTEFFSFNSFSKINISLQRIFTSQIVIDLVSIYEKTSVNLISVGQSINLQSFASRLISVGKIIPQSFDLSTISFRLVSLSRSFFNYFQFSLTGFSSIVLPTTTPSPQVSVGPTGEIVPKAPIKIEHPKALDFTKRPVLVEAKRGQSLLEGIVVKNILDVPINNIYIEVDGLPDNWVSITPRFLSLEPKSTSGFNIFITVPENANNGDYAVSIKLKNSNIEDKIIFILRVKSFIPSIDKAITTRYVAIDREAGKSYVTINVYSGKEFLPKVDIVEDIKKSIANSTDYIKFIDSPDEIIQKDPVVKWTIINFEPNSLKNFSYIVYNLLPEFTSYVYWTLQELSITYTVTPEGIAIAPIKPVELNSGKSNIASITLENLRNYSRNVSLSFILPKGWSSYPEQINYILGPQESKTLSFSIVVPANTYPGYYVGRVMINVDDGVIIKEYPLVVVGMEVWLRSLTFPALIILVAVSMYLIRLPLLRNEERLVLREKLRRIKEKVESSV